MRPPSGGAGARRRTGGRRHARAAAEPGCRNGQPMAPPTSSRVERDTSWRNPPSKDNGPHRAADTSCVRAERALSDADRAVGVLRGLGRRPPVREPSLWNPCFRHGQYVSSDGRQADSRDDRRRPPSRGPIAYRSGPRPLGVGVKQVSRLPRAEDCPARRPKPRGGVPMVSIGDADPPVPRGQTRQRPRRARPAR